MPIGPRRPFITVVVETVKDIWNKIFKKKDVKK